MNILQNLEYTKNRPVDCGVYLFNSFYFGLINSGENITLFKSKNGNRIKIGFWNHSKNIFKVKKEIIKLVKRNL